MATCHLVVIISTLTRVSVVNEGCVSSGGEGGGGILDLA